MRLTPVRRSRALLSFWLRRLAAIPWDQSRLHQGSINWKEVCKFLSGAFFVSAAVLFYLYLTNTPLPLLGMDVVISPAVSGLRSIAHFAASSGSNSRGRAQ